MACLKFVSKAVCLTSLVLSALLPNIVTADSNTTSPASSSYISSRDDVKFAINVPEGAQKTDLYFSFEAPSSYNWVGFGIGMVMDNSLMFVAYRSADDQGEPTVSPRVGHGHNMPEFWNGTQVNVLEGSEVNSDKFVVNLHCKGCRSWGEGRSLDLTNSRARFFYALGPSGKTLMSDNSNERISQHDKHPKLFSLNMTAATGTNGVPVFDSKDSTSNPDQNVSPVTSAIESHALNFHAFAMSFAFSVVFPLGYLFLRTFDRLWMHYGTQSFGALLTLIGMAAGIVISVKELSFPTTVFAHQIVGFIAVGLVLLAMGLGGAGHISFRKRGVPSPIMKAHRVVGPLAIVVGFSAAIMGLVLAGESKFRVIGYAIFDSLVWVIVLTLVFLKKRRNVRKGAMNTAAAQNFRDAPTAYSHVREGSLDFQHAPAVYNPAASQNREREGFVEYYNLETKR